MKQADAYTIRELGVPSLTLMERAANACVDVIEKNVKDPARICVVCGSGNNGGDGFAVARIFKEKGVAVTAVMAGNPDHCTQETAWQKAAYEKAGGLICDKMPDDEYSIIIDALFGVGLNRPVTGKYAQIIQTMNEKTGVKVAVDIPSGISADTGAVLGIAFQADYTVTFQARKTGLMFAPGRICAGEVTVADIGISEKPFLADLRTAYAPDPDEYKKMLPPRKKDSHKGTYGKLLLIAGSKGMSGAAYLNGLAAYRTGAGLVRIYTAEENRTILQTLLPEAIITSYETYQEAQLKELLAWADVVCIGSGLGTGEISAKILDTTVREVNVPCVIDADGLNLLSARESYKDILSGKAVILTPHIKEFSRLTKVTVPDILADRMRVLEKFVQEWNVTCILKDARTVILSPGERACINLSGCSAMAKAGSGDVLTGIAGGLLGQGMSVANAAVLAAYLHGAAGEYARDETGSYGMLARELADAAGKVLKEWEGSV